MPGNELFGAEERKEINEVLETGILFRYNHEEQRKGHWKARDFEQELAAFVKARHTLLCSSGSTAVAIAMAACGLGYGDEVIVPPFTYIATVEGILLGGGIPVFADIDETLNLSPEGIEAVITPRTKAVMLVQMCGAMGRMDEIIDLCKRKNLKLIEDSAQALGASYKGQFAGTMGMMGCYSLDFFKIITAGEGGAVVTNDTELAKRAECFSDHGHDHIGTNRGMENHPWIGFNYRNSELHAAVALAQLRKIDFILEKQRKHKKILHDTLSQFSEVSFRHYPDPAGDSATFLSFFLPDESTTKRVFKAMGENGITGIQYWYDNNYHYLKNWEHLREMKTVAQLPVQALGSPQNYQTLQMPQSDAVISRLISMVVRVTWTEEELFGLCQRLTAIFRNALTKQPV